MSDIILQLMFSIDGDYNNLRNSKILCFSQVIKQRTESFAEKNCDICETGAVSNQLVFVKYCQDFKVFSRHYKRNIKINFLNNVLRDWRFQ